MSASIDPAPSPPLVNGQAIPLAAVPLLSEPQFGAALARRLHEGGRLAALFGRPLQEGDRLRLYAVVADPRAGALELATTEVGDRYEALTPRCPQAHWFEREIAEQWGVRPEGHPWLKPIRFHRSRRAGRDAWGRAPTDPILPGVADCFQVRGAQVHEVAVGPVHAGVIEPGHFRFQSYGEQVLALEISLGYQHRGVEQRLAGGPDKRTIHYMETLAGDTSIGHATACCQALEGLVGREPPVRAQALRAIALELERLANHAGDLGALAGDVGYLPTHAYCGRLRGEFLNLTADLCGSRFGRGLVRPGRVGFDVDAALARQMSARLETALRDLECAADLLWNTPSVMARFEGTGRVSRELARELGLVGMAARASGVDADVRHDFPAGMFRFAQIPMTLRDTGDVLARAYVRWQEIQRSGRFILDQLRSLPAGPVRTELGALAADSIIVSLVEGWRGEICHVVLTGAEGRFAHYKVVDPSFHNWMGLALALRDQPISDFPLCNKSFNLSYCGHDL